MIAELAQMLSSGILTGAVLALPAIGLSLIFSVLRFVNFSVGAQITLGAFLGYAATSVLHCPLPVALGITFVGCGCIGVVSDRIALRRIRAARRPDARLMTAIASIALSVVLENAVRFVSGNEMRSFDVPIARDFAVGPVLVSPQQLQNLGMALLTVCALSAFFLLTRTGKAMRAVADNPDLAKLKGISVVRTTATAVFIGMGVAGMGGMMLGLDTSVDPQMGAAALLTVFAASVVGGLSSIPGAVVGAVIVGIAEQVSLLVVAPSYKSGVAFLVILVVLLVRPEGLFARRERRS
jgi:branched-chain amino acid transport system permease protein